MDTTQAAQMLTWLDEEHRRDRTMLVELRQRVEAQAAEISDQAKRVQELEGRLASTQTRLQQFNQVDQALKQIREELVSIVRQHEDEHIKEDREQIKVRQIERENLARAINELRRGLEPIPGLAERMAIFKAEDQRLTEQVLDLQTKLTSVQRDISPLPDRITYLEAQRSQEQKAIAQLQQEIVELVRRTEGHGTKLTAVEEVARRNEQNIGALGVIRDELKREQARVTEEVKLRQAQQERQITDWAAEINRYTEIINKQHRQLEQFTKQTDTTQQNLIAIDKFKEQVNRELRQAAEVQRMAETRQKQELQEFIAADEQRWTKAQLEVQSRWNQQVARNEEVTNRLINLEGLRREDVQRMQQIAKEVVGLQQEIRLRLMELWRIQERAAAFRLDEVRHWYDEIAEVVRDKIGE